MQIFRSDKVLLEEGVLAPACIFVEDGKIKSIHLESFGARVTGQQEHIDELIDVGELVLMPGLVDTHVHVNEPGRTKWEGFLSATKSAAAGGVTTIIDMPLNSIPSTTNVPALKQKMAAACGQCHVDVGFWGGIVPGNQVSLLPMLREGVCGFKCFMVDSGVEEFPMVQQADIELAMKTLSSTNGVILFHAEVEQPACNGTGPSDPRKYATFLESRPDAMEVEAIRIVCQLCEEYRTRCHIVHLSSADAIPILEEYKTKGLPLTVETTHHYLSVCSEEISDGATEFKACPPIRSQSNQDALWEGVKTGVIDMVVSDHSPSTADLKRIDGNFLKAWGGVSSLQLGLPLLWTGASKKGLTVNDIVKLASQNTSQLAGLGQRKGKISVGYDADFVVWDPDSSWTISTPNLLHKNKVCPYEGMEVFGVVHKTFVRGRLVYDEGIFLLDPVGQFVH